MKKGIFFDVDGTLWDSSVQVAQSWQVAAEKLLNGPRPITPDMISRNMGKNMKDFGDALFPDLPPAKRLEVMEACMEYENQYLEDHPGILYPQVAEVLQQLSWKYKLFIVSNCQRGYIEVMMKGAGMEPYIKDFLCFGQTQTSKDQTILKLMEKNNLTTPVYVGDTQSDADSCKKAGVPFIFAEYGLGDVKEDYPTIHSF